MQKGAGKNLIQKREYGQTSDQLTSALGKYAKDSRC